MKYQIKNLIRMPGKEAYTPSFKNGILDMAARKVVLNDKSILESGNEPVNICFETEDGGVYIARDLFYTDEKTLMSKVSDNEKWLYRADEIAQYTDEDTTNLDMVLAGLPWREDMKIGAGIDAITGMAHASAIEDFTVKETESITTNELYTFIENKNDYEMLINVSVSGKFNIEGVNINASTEFMNSVKYSNTATTLFADYSLTDIGYNEAKAIMDYQLTEEARELMDTDPQGFRGTYGDYFVAGTQNSARFSAVYICEANSAEELTKFKASLGVDAPGVFDVNGATAFQKATRQFNIKTEVRVFMFGISKDKKCPVGAPWTFQKISEALEWFKINAAPVPARVKLKHYKTIVPAYSSIIRVPPSAFSELSFLYQRAWVIMSMYHSLPVSYLSRFQERFVRFDKELKAHKIYLAENAAKRDYFRDLAGELLKEMENVFTRQKFYFELLGKSEPDENMHFSADKGIGTWIYGETNAPDNAIQIESIHLVHSAEWQFAKKQEYTFDFRSHEKNKNYLIVGWKVIDRWTDGSNGGWHKACNKIIGSSAARIFVQSQLTRGFSWGVQFFYVNAADYQF